MSATPRCQMPAATRAWIEGSLAAWDAVREHDLRLAPETPPPLLFFDRSCAYTLRAGGAGRIVVHANGDTLRGDGHPHGGRIALPNGLTIPVRAEAFATLLPGDTATLLVMSLEDVWRGDMQMGGINEDWPGFLRRTFIHEMAHARQLVALTPLLRVAGGRIGLRDFDDDIIQQRFDTVAGFRESVRRETELLFQAAAARSVSEQRSLTSEALALMERRRARAYGDADAPWARVEQLLLDMEGAAQWAAYAHVRRTSRVLGAAGSRDVVRGSRLYWSQEQGLALYAVLADLVPDWPARMFSADPPTSIELLRAALAG